MSAKMSGARRAAFFKALAETGNRTLAAEAAKASQSWVTLHRGRDPEFRRAMEAAIAEARERLSRAPDRVRGERESNRPPRGWGFLDGEELVVRGSGGSALRDAAGAAPQGERKKGRRVQIARARPKQWTARVEERFLAALAATCNVKAACAEAGMWPPSAYAHRKRWPGFARRWDETIEIAAVQLEFALVTHAMNPFSQLGPARPAPVPPMRADQALHNLHMHKRQLHGLGGRPGLPASLPPAEEVRARMVRAVEAVERARALSEAEKAEAEQEYARRRSQP